MSALEELALVVGVEGVFLCALWILGVLFDLILPHLGWLNDWIDTLPMMKKDKTSS